ncbi:ATP-binding cassette domain-containing protein [Mucilaginibacter robiniae]|uniref:ATP-binding cassette domain-containing protein n=1 Tax=Mucilaginibacter robiniae TaxID=2728022 RepID=A0A7L5E2K1_9SPHI|nr:ABC transporter ATP-binding protein [Mucilaginibacter robiniae]QJD97365.1 ATP-binding cassette domain-containing protein [Mucilaginibacter robiniae]
MSKIAIKAENLSKAYQLGEFSTGTLSRDIQRRIALMRGKEDPYLKIGETNDRTSKGASDIVWSLKDINFEINQGDAVGVIGRNGAGKSTLLKVLSRVTTPSTGSIKIKGRVASLLEVGTGFHPELTGRENIFLNGAILGMRKHEIKKHFDAIVDFAGVERYIDTPVKRYSSGMYVRLAFAVAAHLESEILIVDEVLAVGDAEFQKKCLGKMGDVNKGEGRTVLFVSHSMQSIAALTTKTLLLSNGSIAFEGNTQTGIKKYYEYKGQQSLVYTNQPSSDAPVITKVTVNTSEANNLHLQGKPLKIDFEINTPYPIGEAIFSFLILNSSQVKVAHVLVRDDEMSLCRETGVHKFSCSFPQLRLYPDNYSLIINFSDHRSGKKFEVLEGICPFEVQVHELRKYYWYPNAATYVEDHVWQLES